jgi:hypothetical protein
MASKPHLKGSRPDAGQGKRVDALSTKALLIYQQLELVYKVRIGLTATQREED